MSFVRTVSLLLSLGTALSVRAQITAVTVDQTPPVPGAGHDFIKLLDETVNPANGAVSIRIDVPLPKGRASTLPFAIEYDSNAAHHYLPVLSNGSYWTDNAGYLAQGGWSYALPSEQFTYTVGAGGLYNTGGGGNNFVPCPLFYNYMATDVNGTPHDLGIALPPSLSSNCTIGNNPWPTQVLSGGDTALFGSTTASTAVSTDTPPPPLTVTDGDGNVYYYSNNALRLHLSASGLDTERDHDAGWSVGPNTALPDYIEDRNGNKITFTDNRSGQISIADDINRTVLTTSGFGNTGDSISISGLGGTTTTTSGITGASYTTSWTSEPYNFSLPTETLASQLITQYYPTATSTCGTGNETTSGSQPVDVQLSGSQPEITTLTLPNGETYTFTYESQFGEISQITYPTKAYVKYDWQLTPSYAASVLTAPYPSDTESNATVVPWFATCETLTYSPAVWHRYVSFDGSTVALEQTFSYSTSWAPTNPGYSSYPSPYLAWSSKTTTVKTQDLVRGTTYTTTYTYQPGGALLNYENEEYTPEWFTGVYDTQPEETGVQTTDFSGNALTSVTESYATPYLPPADKQTRLNGIVVSDVQNAYTSVPIGSSTYPLYIITDSCTYSGVNTSTPCSNGGSLLVHTHADYSTPITTPIGGIVADRPSDIKTYDGSGQRWAETDYLFDGATSSGGAPSAAAYNSIPATGHDEANFSVNYLSRGNVTTITKQCFIVSPQGTCPNIVTNYVYNQTGQLHSRRDALNNTTTYGYTDSFSDMQPSSNTSGYLTQITYPAVNVAHLLNYSYRFSDGQLSAATDENGQTTYYSYSAAASGSSNPCSSPSTPDPWGRLMWTCYPDGGIDGNLYNDAGPNPTVTQSVLLNTATDSTKTTETIEDAAGRAIQKITTDPEGNIYADTCYDGAGKVYKQSNPYRGTAGSCSSDPSSILTTYTYDSIERLTQTTHPDSTSLSNTYYGRAVLAADEGTVTANGSVNIQHVSQVDALGRTVAVCEVSATTQQGQTNNTPSTCSTLDISKTGFLTTYSHDPLGNLTGVAQGNVNRIFVFDSNSHLITANNPETGTTTYSYDSNGNLSTKIDARSITTTYNFDGLYRLTGKSYSGGTANTPAACFQYDQNASQYGIGRLAAEWTQSSACAASGAPPATGAVTERIIPVYDKMGRIKTDEQCTNPGNCGGSFYSVNYTYDAVGNVTSFTNGLTGTGAMSFANVYDSVARLQSVTGPTVAGSSTPTTPLFTANSISPVSYAPQGDLAYAQLGGNITLSRAYDNRLRATNETDTQGNGPGTATVQITGSEQVYAYSSGSITFSGSEQCSGSTCDAGNFVVNVGTDQGIQIQYSSTSTAASLASNLASVITCGGSGVQAVASGGTVYLQSCAAGTNTNYPISAYADGHSSSFAQYSFSVSTSGSSMTPIMNASTTGSNVITFSGTEQNGQTGNYGFFIWPVPNGPPLQYVNVNWGSGSTPTSLALAVASAWSSCSSGQAVRAVAAGPSVYITPCQNGLNYTIQVILNAYNGGSGPDLLATAGTANLGSVVFSGSEQQDQGGAIGVRINGTAITTSWGSGSTPSTLATGLSAALGSCSTNGNLMVGLASGANVYLAPCIPTATYQVQAEVFNCGCQVGNGPSFSVAYNGPTPSLPPIPTGAIYDSGTVSLTVDGTQIASVPYGSASTTASIASALATSGSGNDLATVQATGNSLTITGTNGSYSLSIASSNPSDFSPASFGSSAPSGSLQGTSNSLLYSWAINTYAPNSDVVSVNDSVMGSWSYTYDDLHRLSTGSATANGAGGNFSGMNLSWTYDRYGNRWDQNLSGSGQISQPHFTFNGVNNVVNNRIDGDSYDADGDLLNDSNYTYTYDAENRIAAVNGQASYIYDAAGRRVAKLSSNGSTMAVYILGLGGGQLTEVNAAGQLVHTNIIANDRLLATYEGPGGQTAVGYHYQFSDWLRTKRMQTDLAGDQPELCISFPFGDGLSCNGSADATEHHFTGKEHDSESGLDYFGARYNSNSMGRFMTPDWSHSSQAIPYADLENPQSLNLYTYVENNPVSQVDADGHCSVWRWLCNLAQRIKNGVTFRGFVTDQTRDDRTEERRKWLEQHTMVINGDGSTIDWSTANESTIDHWFRKAGGASNLNTPALPIPPGLKGFSDFGKTMGWGTGDAEARARMESLTKEELEEKGVTKEMAEKWRDFYKAEKARNPGNPSAEGRAELMQRAADLLDDGSEGEGVEGKEQ